MKYNAMTFEAAVTAKNAITNQSFTHSGIEYDICIVPANIEDYARYRRALHPMDEMNDSDAQRYSSDNSYLLGCIAWVGSNMLWGYVNLDGTPKV